LEFLPKNVQDAFTDIEAIGGGVTVTNEGKFDLTGGAKKGKSGRELKGITHKGVKMLPGGLLLLDGENKGVNMMIGGRKTVGVTGKDKVVSIAARVSADVIADALKND